MQAFMSRMMADRFLLVWNISAVVTFMIPFFIFVIGRARSDEWNQYWEEKENNNNNENNNENNYNNGQYNNGNQNNGWNNPNCYDEYGYYQGPTHWWEFWKKCNYGEEEGEENDQRSPWWYIWGGEEREPEEEGRSAAVTFIYLWMLILFSGLVYMGNNTNMSLTKLELLRYLLFGFANLCFVLIVLLIGLEGIEVDAREMERDGFYGQTAVLLWITSVFGMIQSIIFISWTTKRINVLKSLQEEDSPTDVVGMKSETGTGDYVAVEYDQQLAKTNNGQQAPPGYVLN